MIHGVTDILPGERLVDILSVCVHVCLLSPASRVIRLFDVCWMSYKTMDFPSPPLVTVCMPRPPVMGSSRFDRIRERCRFDTRTSRFPRACGINPSSNLPYILVSPRRAMVPLTVARSCCRFLDSFEVRVALSISSSSLPIFSTTFSFRSSASISRIVSVYCRLLHSLRIPRLGATRAHRRLRNPL